jgi:DNA repair protein RecN (Recombination protein N)
LKRKYGDSIEHILKYYDQISQELLDSDFSGDKLEKLEKELIDKEEQLHELAKTLQTARKNMAEKLEAEIQRELKDLYMENARFKVVFKEIPFVSDGIDEVEFYITTNPGEPLKPLVKVASGGEISRIMLALKTIFSKTQELTSIVFDEVDTGVSGRVAQAIADKIYQIGKNSQALCITHLPQVAAKADHQLFIRKGSRSDRRDRANACWNRNYRSNGEACQRIIAISKKIAGAAAPAICLHNTK